jgi:hypothetical protein
VTKIILCSLIFGEVDYFQHGYYLINVGGGGGGGGGGRVGCMLLDNLLACGCCRRNLRHGGAECERRIKNLLGGFSGVDYGE